MCCTGGIVVQEAFEAVARGREVERVALALSRKAGTPTLLLIDGRRWQLMEGGRRERQHRCVCGDGLARPNGRRVGGAVHR